MKTAFSFILLIIFNLSLFKVYAQDKPDTTLNSAVNSIKKNSWSLQFEIGSFIDSKTFESYLISFKKHFSEKYSIRLGFGISTSNSSGQEDYSSSDSITSYPNNNNYFNVKILAAFLIYPNPKSNIKIFFGAGPIYSYNKSTTTDNYTFYDSQGMFTDNRKTDSKQWSAGINGIFGVEWFPFRSISLIGEYNANIEWGKLETNNEEFVAGPYEPSTTTHHSNQSNTFESNVDIVRLGVSVYF